MGQINQKDSLTLGNVIIPFSDDPVEKVDLNDLLQESSFLTEIANVILGLADLLTELQAKTDESIFINRVDITNTALSNLLTELQAKADLTETQPISANALPLPTGASTEISLTNLITAVNNLLTELQLKADLTETQPISVVALPLPTGASTETTVANIVTSLGNLLTELQGKADLVETQPVLLKDTVSGGNNVYRNLNLGSTGQLIKNSAGQVYGYYIFNGNATSTLFIKLYDKASAPTIGTDVPVMTIPLPSGAAANIAIPHGLPFSLGIGIGATTGIDDSDTGNPTTNNVVVNVFYK